MNYQKERFRQHTPYLQWLQEQPDSAGQKGLGERVCRLSFSSCMQAAAEIVDLDAVSADMIYLFVNGDGMLSPSAADEMAAVFFEKKKTEFVYADEDYLGTLDELYGISGDAYSGDILAQYQTPGTGLYRGSPWFKPDFSPDTLHSFFYIGSIFAVRGSALLKAYQPDASLYELAVDVLEAAWAEGRKAGDAHAVERIVHLPRVLFTNSCLEKSGMLEGRDCLGKRGSVRERKGTPLVSIIIPSRDNSAMLFRCLGTLTECTKYTEYELIVVDNGSSAEEQLRIRDFLGRLSGCQYIYEKQPFHFSVMCNAGAQAARGEYLLFLNDDIEIIDGNWLGAMLESAARPHVGAVGAKLYYPKKDSCYLIQHAGITNMGVGSAHKLCGMEDAGNLYHGRNMVTYNMLAVTGACLMVEKKKFVLAGGFDRELAVAYNDVELCIRLYERGFYNVLQNDAVLVHHESQSRGRDVTDENRKRLALEKETLYKKHPAFNGWDPFYSPNLVQWKKDVAYNTSYLYDFDRKEEPKLLDNDGETGKRKRAVLKRYDFRNFLRAKCPLAAKIYDRLTGYKNLMLQIDKVDEDGVADDTITIEGWCAVRNRDNADIPRRLWLFDSRSVYEFDIAPKLREDAAALLEGNDGRNVARNTALSGIQVNIGKSALKPGTYSIGVLCQNKLVCSPGKYVRKE